MRFGTRRDQFGVFLRVCRLKKQVNVIFSPVSIRPLRKKMSLSILKRNAAAFSQYIRFDDLEIGKYRVKKFSLCDNLYGSGKRVMVHINDGYVILPQRMVTGCNTRKDIDNLNRDKYIMVFEGKDDEPPHRINIDFEMIRAPKRSSGSVLLSQAKKKKIAADFPTNKKTTPTKKPMKKGKETMKKSTLRSLVDGSIAGENPIVTEIKKRAVAAKKKMICGFIDDEAEEEDEDGNVVNKIGDESGSECNDYDYDDDFIDDSPELEEEGEEGEEAEMIDDDDNGGDNGDEQVEMQTGEPNSNEVACGSSTIAGHARKIFVKKQQPKKKTPAKE